MIHEIRGRTLSAADFLDHKIDEPDPLVHGVIPGGTITVLAGQHKVGKTIAMLQMSLAVASGHQWINWPTSRGRVVYFNGEVAEWGFQQRLNKAITGFVGTFGKEAGAAIRTNLFTNTLSDLRLNKSGDLGIIRETVDNTRAQLCVIDPISYFYTGQRNDDEAVARVMSNILTQLVQPTGCSVVLGHHMRKPAPGEGGSGSSWEVKGSGVWADTSDQILTMRWDRKDESRLTRFLNTTLRYYESQDNIKIRLRPAAMLFEPEGPTGSPGPTDTDRLRNAFTASLHGELTMQEISAALGISLDAARKRFSRGDWPLRKVSGGPGETAYYTMEVR